ncbi:MAG: phosphate ABC transporter permease PstA [Chloroflexaceae bacterium]|nr:phosphate ABC transporter permease PstA [Chloroflexaceae bacterium]
MISPLITPAPLPAPDLEIHQPLPAVRSAFSLAMTVVGFVLMSLALLPLAAILVMVVVRGIDHLSWATLTSLPAPPGVEDQPNGFVNALAGSAIMIAIAIFIALPLGSMTGVLLAEFTQKTKLSAIIRSFLLVLASIPTLIIGVFVWHVLVKSLKSFSAIAGGVALSLVMLPIIALTTEEALKLVPQSYRLGSAALGGGRLPTVFRIAIPAALPAITTGTLLAIARAAGETAPVLLTAGYTAYWSEGLLKPTLALPHYIFLGATSPFADQTSPAWTAALVLLALVLVTNVLSRVLLADVTKSLLITN